MRAGQRRHLHRRGRHALPRRPLRRLPLFKTSHPFGVADRIATLDLLSRGPCLPRGYPGESLLKQFAATPG
jgi:hypothetical protein